MSPFFLLGVEKQAVPVPGSGKGIQHQEMLTMKSQVGSGCRVGEKAGRAGWAAEDSPWVLAGLCVEAALWKTSLRKGHGFNQARTKDTCSLCSECAHLCGQ